jgi:diguanylate cyclase (GGDEF)-like protein/PAS domain S-box-containing protein
MSHEAAIGEQAGKPYIEVLRPGAQEEKCRLLLVNDSSIDRSILRLQLEDIYWIDEVNSGSDALKLLESSPGTYAAVVLDLIMPGMDGYAVLKAMQQSVHLRNIPVLVATAESDKESEKKCLDLGAWDFIIKPYDADIIRMRLKNVIARTRLAASEKIRYLSEHDPLTGFYNRAKFLHVVQDELNAHPEDDLALVRLDLDQFSLFSTFFGEEEGEHLLRYVAGFLHKLCAEKPVAFYGRMDSDVFCVCVPFDQQKLEAEVNEIIELLSQYNPSYHLEPSIGIYHITDKAMAAEAMFARATMAANKCKNKYMTYFAYYDEKMTQELLSEQAVINDAQQALDEEQFLVYLQPKYDLRSELPCGAEALVRWDKPGKGIVSPGMFVPVFEQNGFITKLDYYMWEHTCALLSKWQKQGRNVLPVSVNISRANMYNPNLADMLSQLVKKYDIAPRLLELELTESAYMDNPDLMRNTVGELRRRGFVVLMDDFGSGYSSLNTLKNIEVDVLKVDMKFLPTGGENNAKSERILASVIRMASWLDLKVIVEGVETEQQKNFLEGVGCNFVQGYYYAKPMPVEQYETLVAEAEKKRISAEEKARMDEDLVRAIWNASPKAAQQFEQLQEPAGIFEYAGGTLTPLRVNQSFCTAFGYSGEQQEFEDNFNTRLAAEDTNEIKEAFRQALKTRDFAQCVYKRLEPDASLRWVELRLQYIQSVADGAVFLGVLQDITRERTMEGEFSKYTQIVQASGEERSKLLVVDDSDFSRRLVSNVFQHKFQVLEAADGAKGLETLKENAGSVAAVLLDMMMPVMDGREFMKYKNADPELAAIPVVVISSMSSHMDQNEIKELGVSDLIAKPFIPQVLERHVQNAIVNACFLRRREHSAAGKTTK